jgi:hypothetical protein
MAGDVTVAVVHGQLSNSSTGFVDLTEADFGTPKACIVILGFDTTDDGAVQNTSRMSIGFSDFTNHRCITHQDEHGSAKVDCDALKSNTKAYVLLNAAGSVFVDGTASIVTDGVRLTNTSANGTPFVTVVMFGGADLQVSLDSISTPNSVGGTVKTTTNIDQDLVFFIGTDISAEDSASSGINNSFGVAHIDTSDHATFVNRAIGWSSDHNNAEGTPYASLRTARCLSIHTETGNLDWQLELTAADTTSYTLTERDVSSGNGMEIYALALDLDDRKSKIGSVDSPTSGATWTPSVSLGFTPQYVGLSLTDLTAEDGTISKFGAEAGALGISSNTGAGNESCHSWYNEDDSATIDTANLFSSNAIDFYTDDTVTQLQDHSHSSFNDGDWTYTINAENETAAKKWFYWAIETDVVAAVPVVNLVMAPYVPA